MRYPPYGPEKIKLFNKMIGDPSPQYPRNWKAIPLPTWKRVMLLGARTKITVIFRYLLVLGKSIRASSLVVKIYTKYNLPIAAVFAIGKTSLGSYLGFRF